MSINCSPLGTGPIKQPVSTDWNWNLDKDFLSVDGDISLHENMDRTTVISDHLAVLTANILYGNLICWRDLRLQNSMTPPQIFHIF